jgi:plasmid maintenance system antidote protein VapI
MPRSGRPTHVGPVLARDGTFIAQTIKEATQVLGLTHQRIYQLIGERRSDGTVVLKR